MILKLKAFNTSEHFNERYMDHRLALFVQRSLIQLFPAKLNLNIQSLNV